MRSVWPRRIIEENSLEAQISILRRALGPERAAIRTIAGRGYKFIGMLRAPSEEIPTRTVVRLPSSISRLIGRQTEIESLFRIVEGNRPLTLIGPGGIGKTRLAIELARQVAGGFAEGVCMAELAPIAEPRFVPLAVSAALGLTPTDTMMSFERIATVLGARRRLLVLDNCEHLIGASAAIVTTLLQASPGLHIIATSRETLRVEGEYVFNVPPLDVPDIRVSDMSLAMASSAMQLFDARLSYGQANIPEGARSVALKAQICRRLDGIPLAIELAAARVQVFGIAGVAERLENLFDRKREFTHTSTSRRVGLDHAGTKTSSGLATLNGNRSLISASAARCGSSVSTRSR